MPDSGKRPKGARPGGEPDPDTDLLIPLPPPPSRTEGGGPPPPPRRPTRPMPPPPPMPAGAGPPPPPQPRRAQNQPPAPAAGDNLRAEVEVLRREAEALRERDPARAALFWGGTAQLEATLLGDAPAAAAA